MNVGKRLNLGKRKSRFARHLLHERKTMMPMFNVQAMVTGQKIKAVRPAQVGNFQPAFLGNFRSALTPPAVSPTSRHDTRYVSVRRF